MKAFENEKMSLQTCVLAVLRRVPWVCAVLCPQLLCERDWRQASALVRSLATTGSRLNRVVTSVWRVLAASLLTYALYAILRYQITAPIASASMFAALATVYVCLLVAVLHGSDSLRCRVWLFVPFMAVGSGRDLLSARCYQLLFSSIVPNIRENANSQLHAFECNRRLSARLTKSAIGGDERVLAMRAHLTRIGQQAALVARKLEKVKRVVKKASGAFRKVKAFLKQIGQVCSNTLGKPREMCLNMTQGVIQKYYVDKLQRHGFAPLQLEAAKFLPGLCNTINVAQGGCNSIEDRVSDLSDKLVDEMWQPMIEQMRVQVVYHEPNVYAETNVTEAGTHMAKHMFESLERRAQALVERYVPTWLNVDGVVCPFSFVLVAVLVWLYHRKYVRRDHFDNYVICPRFVEMDERRAAKGTFINTNLN